MPPRKRQAVGGGGGGAAAAAAASGGAAATSTTPFDDLPPEMLGLVYGHLPTKEDRRNFAHSCKAVHSAPDVLHRITSLTWSCRHCTSRTPRLRRLWQLWHTSQRGLC